MSETRVRSDKSNLIFAWRVLLDVPEVARIGPAAPGRDQLGAVGLERGSPGHARDGQADATLGDFAAHRRGADDGPLLAAVGAAAPDHGLSAPDSDAIIAEHPDRAVRLERPLGGAVL